MNQKNDGLTVGELTMAIGAILIVCLIWSGITKKHESKVSLSPLNNYLLVAKDK